MDLFLLDSGAGGCPSCDFFDENFLLLGGLSLPFFDDLAESPATVFLEDTPLF